MSYGSDRPSLRRWNGKSKEARLWKILMDDTDILGTRPDSNCSIFLSEVVADRDRPSIRIPLSKLVRNDCQPLLDKVVILGSSQAKLSDENTGRKTYPEVETYILRLSEPSNMGIEEKLQYHITTRNFFVWLMDKPIVGFDLSSALQSLRSRMDIWRAPGTDNVSDMSQYAKRQGYGNACDLQADIPEHLRNPIAIGSGYKLISSAPGGSPGILLRQTTRLIKLFQGRQASRPPHVDRENSDSLSSIDHLPTLALENTDKDFMSGVVMSGALSSVQEDSIVSVPVRHPILQSSLHTTIKKANSVNTLPQDTNLTSYVSPVVRLSPYTKPKYQRTYSMPNLPQGSIDHVSHELELGTRGILWAENPSKNMGSLTGNMSNVTKSSRSNIDSQPKQSILPERTMPKRHRASLSRPPSPIPEEISELCALNLPPTNLRRYSLPAARLGRLDDIMTPRGTAHPGRDVSHKQSRSADAVPVVDLARFSSLNGTTRCAQEPLPSHTNYSCKSCGRPKHSNLASQSTLARKTTATLPDNMEGFPFERPDSDKVSAAHWSFTEVSSDPVDSMRGLDDNTATISRFPSLNNLKAKSVPIMQEIESTESIQTSDSKHQPNHTESTTLSIPTAHLANGRDEANSIKPKMDSTTSTGISSANDRSNPTDQSVTTFYSFVTLDNGARIDAATNEIDVPTIERTDQISPLVGSKVPNGKKDYLRTQVKDPDIMDVHRVPLDELYVHGGSTQTIDSILAHIPVPPSKEAVESLSIGKNISAIETVRTKASKEPRVSRGIEGGHEKPPKRMSQNLRLWTSRKKAKVVASTQNYQGKVLTMDSSGNFSTIQSPIDSPVIFWKENFGRKDKRSITPICEMP